MYLVWSFLKILKIIKNNQAHYGYDLFDIDINELNLYSWFVTGENFFSTSDTFYFAIDATQMNLNDGRKRKFLYFQTDYELKQ